MSKKFTSFENDPSPKWDGVKNKATLCDKCLNRLSDGSCDEHTQQEIGHAIDTGSCPDYLKKHS